MENHSQVEQEKPYVFKRQAEEKDEQGNVVKKACFKAFKRPANSEDAPTELLEGFELEEFNSPLVGHRYISSLLKAIEEKAVTQAAEITPTPEISSKGFEIPLIGEEPEIHVFGSVRYFRLTVHEQDNDMKRKDIYLTDGVSRDFQVMFDVPVILPEGCLNVLRESIYTQHECIDDVQNGKVILIEKQVPRFSIQVDKEVPQVEAEEWLRGTKKIILQKV